jgi:hypothetical protein
MRGKQRQPNDTRTQECDQYKNYPKHPGFKREHLFVIKDQLRNQRASTRCASHVAFPILTVTIRAKHRFLIPFSEQRFNGCGSKLITTGIEYNDRPEISFLN